MGPAPSAFLCQTGCGRVSRKGEAQTCYWPGSLNTTLIGFLYTGRGIFLSVYLPVNPDVERCTRSLYPSGLF